MWQLPAVDNFPNIQLDIPMDSQGFVVLHRVFASPSSTRIKRHGGAYLSDGYLFCNSHESTWKIHNLSFLVLLAKLSIGLSSVIKHYAVERKLKIHHLQRFHGRRLQNDGVIVHNHKLWSFVFFVWVLYFFSVTKFRVFRNSGSTLLKTTIIPGCANTLIKEI